MLLGRAEERARLTSAIDAARAGQSATVVVRGGAGIGKTALLVDVAHSAVDFDITHVTAPETEIEVPYAGLIRLLSPFVSTLDRIARPSQDALKGAFGLSSDASADRHAVGLAALALLSAAARTRPVLCVVDDAQWLDLESRDALLVIARRLGADRIAMLLGVRDSTAGAAWYAELPQLMIGGLSQSDAVDLVLSVARPPLEAEEVLRIADATGGSPLAIIELTTELADRPPAESPDDVLTPLARRIEDHFLAIVRSLPRDAQQLLLVAALDSSGDPDVIARAVDALGVSADAGRVVGSTGLLLLSPAVHFRHPLVRSAVQHSASTDDRRAVHRALAEATDDRLDPERRAWHRSASTSVADDEIAADLVAIADRARARGAHAAAGAILVRASELSSNDADRVDRCLAAAVALGAGGAHERAKELLVRSAPLFRTPHDRARSLRQHGLLRYEAGEARGTAAMLLEAARALQPIDLAEARAAVLQAMAAARITGRYGLPGEGVVAVCAAARTMPLPPHVEPTVVDLLLDGDATLFLEGHQAAVPMLAHALERMRSTDLGGRDGVLWLAVGSWAAGAIGDDVALHDLTQRLVAEARREGAVVGIAHALLYAGMSELFSGSLDAARSYFVERSQLLAAVGTVHDVGELITLAWTGREQEARAEARAVVAHATDRSYGWMLVFVEYAMCVLDLGLGNYRAAFDAGPKTYDDSPFVCLMAFPDLLEAAVRCGERPAAERALDEITTRALTNRTPLAFGLLARSRALLADDPEAEALFLEALEQLDRSRAHIQLARTRLLFGEWLRRQKRRIDARLQLRAAVDVFDRVGANAFAARARRELEATGERARARTPDLLDELTAQEREVAELAASGATNADVAQKLFLSTATVDYHLRKVYRKLGITSRRELATALKR